MGELAGKVALVTGGAQNIGRAICQELAAAGAKILVNTKRSVETAQQTVDLIKQAGGEARVAQADITDEAAVARMVADGIAAYGGIDILVNNAAVRKEAPLTEVSFADWKEVLGIILDGAFLCTKACVPSMKARGGGSIVNIGGMTGHSGAMQRVHVVTGKAGLAGFTKAVALDVAEFGITANCVVPGLIGTARGSHSPTNPNHHANRAMPLGRRGTAQEVAALVRYLAGPQARYVTGQSWHLNGGSYMA
ncbi:MAG TPA: SDR family NAD(P)-dependent oxidoreductase [Dongiaceae bacterium]|nr:SDR family NAD(P)-dependent oxidoreductase [Dongiaceae bacterium]